jgi:methylenetetrahydrofolate reductase (NADPH)
MMTKKNKADLFSFEFYPPKTEEGAVNLEKVHQELAQLNPDFFSVTFGAGGSTRDKTYDTVVKIQKNGVSAAPHLSCVRYANIFSLLRR